MEIYDCQSKTVAKNGAETETVAVTVTVTVTESKNKAH